MKIIQKGAEATIYLDKGKIIKLRERKLYRIPEIDLEKTKYPTRREAKILGDAKRFGVNVPLVLNVDESKSLIEIQYLSGDTLKDSYDKIKNRKQVLKEFGRQISILHEHDIIHGDLTTSNVILFKDKVFLIDFGLSFYSTKIEDRAVDMHLLYQALEAKHYGSFKEDFDYVIEGYKIYKNSKMVLDRLRVVEQRGRYKKKNF